MIARPGRVRLGGPGSARPVLALQGWAWVAWRGRKGPEGRAKRCEAKPGEAGLARRGLGCRAGHGSSRRGSHGAAGPIKAGHGAAWRGSHGVVLQRMDSSARHGPAVKARLGKAWPGLGGAAGGQGAAHRGAGGSARQRVAGQCTAVPARNGAVPMAWLVWARQSRRGPARAARPGMARLVLAGRQGPAGPVTDWRGKAGAAWPAVAWLPGLGTGSPARHRLVRQGRARQGRHGGVTPRRRLICL